MGDVREVLAGFADGARSVAEVLRALVSHPTWHLPVDEDGDPLVAELDDGSELLIATSVASGEPAEVRTGRALVREVEDVDGVIFDPDEPHHVSFRAERLPILRAWADTLDLEDALFAPAPGQVFRLLAGRYRVPVAPGTRTPATLRADELQLVPVATADDALQTLVGTEPAFARGVEWVEMEGRELFAALEPREDWDGVRFDPAFARTATVAPSVPMWWLAGQDTRPGAAPLPARSVAEIHLWLDQQGFRRDGRKQVVVERPTGLVAVYTAWAGYDPVEIEFEVPPMLDDPDDLGDGPSRILCAGKLLDTVFVRISALGDDPAALDARQRSWAAEASRLLRELDKLCLGDRLARASYRTPQGARTGRQNPEWTTRDWIRAEQRRADRLAGAR